MMNLFVLLCNVLMEVFTAVGCFMAIGTAAIIIGSPLLVTILFICKCEDEGGIKIYLKKLIDKLRNREAV